MKVQVLIFCVLFSVVSAEQFSNVNPFALNFKLLQNEDYARNLAKASAVNANKYLDNALIIVRKWLVAKGFDPYRTENIGKEFSVKLGFITYRGEFSLKNGWLQGLSDINRGGDAKMSYGVFTLTMHMPLVFDTMIVNYDYTVKIFNIGPKGGIEAKIKNLKLYVDIDIDTKTAKISLREFKIVDAGKITLRFSGNPLVDWLSNILGGLWTTLLHDIALGVIQRQVRGVLEETIEQYNNNLHQNALY